MSKNRKTWLGIAGALVGIAALLAMLVVSDTAAVAESHEEAMNQGNHYKCYPILDWTEFELTSVTLKDQFGNSQAKVVQPYLLCNPVDKNGEGIADKEDHLVCYQIADDPQGNFERVREVEVTNQFGATRLWVGVPGRELCLPSQKKLIQ